MDLNTYKIDCVDFYNCLNYLNSLNSFLTHLAASRTEKTCSSRGKERKHFKFNLQGRG
jgi:hypothetical protein